MDGSAARDDVVSAAPRPRRRSRFESRLTETLEAVAKGTVDPADAVTMLRDLPFSDLGFAKVDHHRELRQGACEIVLGEGKTAARAWPWWKSTS